MMYANHISSMNELSASEGVFTTAQSARLGITRNALAHACAVGRAERICHGAYRLTGTPASETDELTAIWKLTKPSLFTWERTAHVGWHRNWRPHRRLSTRHRRLFLHALSHFRASKNQLTAHVDKLRHPGH